MEQRIQELLDKEGKSDNLLSLHLQYFADGEGEEDTDPKPGEEDDEKDPEPGEKGDDKPDDKPDEKTFTQEELDRIVQDRVAKEQSRQEKKKEEERKELERKQLEEQEQYKDLADNLQKELDEIKQSSLKAKKEAMLAKAGYTDEQVDKYVKYLDGETEDELNNSLEELKEDIPPKKKEYADPGAGNGGRNKPKGKDLEDKGKSTYQRLKDIGRIK